MSAYKILNIAQPDLKVQDTLNRHLGISKVCAQLLINRGITGIKEAEKFLNTQVADLLNPYLFADMPQAVRLIRQAIKNKNKVMIFGDYDVDGITSLVLLKTKLAKMGGNVLHYVPHRIREGYGLNKNILHLAKQTDIKLFITVDCGTNSHAQIKELRQHGIEVVITDHHESLEGVKPQASAVINPKLKNCGYPFSDLAGVGVVFKLCQALDNNSSTEDLDLVSLGTIADVVPLTDENRIFAKEGLRQLSRTSRPGLKALMETSRISDRDITAHFVSFILGPRINASGRMDTAEVAVNLLMSERQDDALGFARVIENHNRQRQKIEARILEEAEDLIDREINFQEHKVIVLAKEDWHQGVLGIVAAKLADRFYRPTILISLGRQTGKGSARSVKNFHLFQSLLECREYLKTFGGHSHAAGLVIHRDNIEHFKKKINLLAQERLSLQDLLPSLEVDMELGLSDLQEGFIAELEKFAPFGTGNPEPLFFSPNLALKSEPQILSRETLKFWVTDGQSIYPAIGFGMGSYADSLKRSSHFNLVYTPKIDRWQDEQSVILEVKDIFFQDF